MKLEFPSFGGGSGAALPLPRRLIERRMRQFDVQPLDDTHRTIRTGVIVALLFFGLFGLFALLVPINGAAIAPGQVTVSGSRLVIQPIASGLVAELLVHEGQQVRAGQPLVRLNGVRSGAALTQAQAQRDALRATEARLLAQIEGRDTLVFPPDLAQRSADPTVAAAMKAQQALFLRHRAVLTAEQGISGTKLDAARARQAAAERQLALIEDELSDYRSLYAKGFARKTTIRALERNAAQLKADNLAGLAAIEEAALTLRRTQDSQSVELVSQLKQVQDELAQVNPKLDINRYEADRDLLRAPADGRVSGLAQIGPGTVVEGGHTLMELVPVGRALIIEADVDPKDIDDVRVGSEAIVRFSSVNPHGQTAFKGKVVTLSPAAVNGEGTDATPRYRAQIVLDDPAAAQRSGLALQPGIPASVNITTQARTLFDYLMQPFGDAVSKSFREE
jgi:HlyD family type I secretion membrane fusion protein